MSVNTNDPANIGLKSVAIEGYYISSLSAAVPLPSTAWVLNVKECIPSFTLTTQPESPVDYTIDSVGTSFTTNGAIKYIDSNNCGILPTLSCKLSNGAACPSWISVNASNKITVRTKELQNLGQQIVNIVGTYISSLGSTVELPVTSWVINLKVLGVQSVNPSAYNILPNFVIPNDWPEKVILGCSEAWVLKVPDCADPNNDICTEKIELGTAVMFANYNSTSREIYIERDKLTTDFKGEYLV
jgi:hypothetical protein